MLEITVSDTEKKLLERTNLFNQDDLISFCLLLSYGKIDNLMNCKERKVGNVAVNVIDQFNGLNEAIKRHKDIRIWYSGNENEDANTACFLVNYLKNYDVNIYLCNVMSEYCFGLGCYNEKEVKGLLERTILLSDEDKNKYVKLWEKLEIENLDLRIVENDTIKSYSFDYLDKKILQVLKESGTISYWKFIARCMADRIYNFCSDFFFKTRVDYLIDNKLIKVVKIEKEKNYWGEDVLTKYISVVSE